MKRFVIVPKRKGGYVIPSLEVRNFPEPFKLGSWASDYGDLWTSLNDGKHIFEDEELAKSRLQEIIKELFA